MRGRVETIPGSEQDALLRSRLAKGAAVLSAGQPGEGEHSAARGNPGKRLMMLSYEGGDQAKILSCRLLCLPEDDVTAAHGNLRQDFSGSVVGNGKIGARHPVTLAALRIVFDHPTGPHS